MGDSFESRLADAAARTESALARHLSAEPGQGEVFRPPRLVAAMRHGALDGGKRLRPFLLIEAARLFDRNDDAVVAAAVALECVHSYSLVHDDLPAMDDDDLRRGRPTVHRQFDEATAILAGDALLTLAFDILAGGDFAADVAVDLVRGLARASGVGGMAGGQMLDIEAEGVTLDAAAIGRLQSMKTGALFRFAAEAGAIVAAAAAADRARLARFGGYFGQAFQIADDLIDATGRPEEAGKRTAKDADRGKATLVALAGVDAARERLAHSIEAAIGELQPFGRHGDVLASAARFIGRRFA